MPVNTSTTNGGSALVPSNMITLPSIPNSTPPPPQQVTVVTPAAAQADVAQKQNATNSVAAAVTAQTQNKLASAVPVNPTQAQLDARTAAAGATTSPQTTAPANNGQTNGTQQPAPQPTAAAGTTVLPQPPNTTAVTLPNGVQAYYNSNTQQLSTTTGQQLTWNQAQNAWVDPNTGQPPVPPGAPNTTGVPATGDPTTDYINQQLQQNQVASDTAAQQHQDQLNQILNGTFPLTADQQAQVAALQTQFDQLKTLQQQANANFTGATTVLGIRSGRNQYAPELATAQINAAVNTGIQKLAAIDSQASQAVSTLKQGFLDNDYKVINQAYSDLQASITAKNNTLSEMQNNIKTQVDIETQRIQQQTASLALQTNQISSIAQSALASSMKLDGTLDLNQIQSIADANGVDANALYGAVVKAQQAETTFQQSESKFATDQLQAAATLTNTKATTANTYANTAKTKAETAALQPLNTASLPAGTQPLVSAFNSAVTGLPAAQAAQAKTTFNGLVNQGDVQGAKDYIIRVAASSLPAGEQTQVIGRSEALNALTDIQSLLDQAKTKSNDTGLIKGTLINVATKYGQSADPDLQYIGSRIQQELQVYRRAMTGVAFSPQEAAQYSSIFPDITNAEGLNTTKVQALTDGLNSNNRADLEFAIGKNNYDQIFSPTPSQLPSQKSSAPQVTAGSTISYQGKNYSVDAQGNMTAI